MSAADWYIDDTAAARAEMATNPDYGQYGIHPNAEQMILAHRLSQDPANRQVGFLEVDEEATGDLDLRGVKEQFDVPGEVMSAAVRGAKGTPRAISIVYLDATGRTQKMTEGFDEGWKRPAMSPAEAAMRARHRHEQAVAGEVSAMIADSRAQIAQAANEIQQETQRAIEQMRTDAQRDLQRMQERLFEQQQQGKQVAVRDAPPGEPVPGYGEDGEPSPLEGEPMLTQDEPEDEPEGDEPERDEDGEPAQGRWPRTHAEVDAIAAEHGVTFDASLTKVSDKTGYLESVGIEPPSEESDG